MIRNGRLSLLPCVSVLVALCALSAAAQTTRPTRTDTRPSVAIKTTRVAGDVYMLEGRGGNIGVCIGEGGVLMIDDQFAVVTPLIVEAIAKLTPQSIRFIINTHHHGDHVGGNENFGKAGVVIVAHENVRKHMSADQLEKALKAGQQADPNAASLPVITFRESVTFHWAGDELRVLHVPPAHTDGDAIIHFVAADVIHTGDLFFNGTYPVIDAAHGGHIDGMIAAAGHLLALCKAETRIIPGHGPLAGVDDLKAFRDMLETVRSRVQALLSAGKSVDEVIAARPTADLDARWGAGFMKAEGFVRNVAAMMSQKK